MNTVVFWGHFGFSKFWPYHVITILKSFNLRYILDSSTAPILRYGNSDTFFLITVNFFTFSQIFQQNCMARQYHLFSTPFGCQEIQKWPKKCLSTLKKFQNYFWHEILPLIVLNKGNIGILWLETSTCLFSSFFETPEKMDLHHKI